MFDFLSDLFLPNLIKKHIERTTRKLKALGIADAVPRLIVHPTKIDVEFNWTMDRKDVLSHKVKGKTHSLANSISILETKLRTSPHCRISTSDLHSSAIPLTFSTPFNLRALNLADRVRIRRAQVAAVRCKSDLENIKKHHPQLRDLEHALSKFSQYSYVSPSLSFFNLVYPISHDVQVNAAHKEANRVLKSKLDQFHTKAGERRIEHLFDADTLTLPQKSQVNNNIAELEAHKSKIAKRFGVNSREVHFTT